MLTSTPRLPSGLCVCLFVCLLVGGRSIRAKMLGGVPCAVLELSMLLVGVHVGCAMFNYRMQPVNNNRFSLNINRNTQGLAPCGKCVTVFGEMSSSSSSSFFWGV